MLISLPGFVAPGDDAKNRILREASRYCPDFSFWDEPTSIHVLRLVFYERVVLVRLAWGDDEKPSQEVYALYEPGLFLPIDDAGDTLSRTDKTAPLELLGKSSEETQSRIRQYLRFRFSFLGSAGDILGSGRPLRARFVDRELGVALKLAPTIDDSELKEFVSHDRHGDQVHVISTYLLQQEPDREPSIRPVQVTVWLDGHLLVIPGEPERTATVGSDDYHVDETGRGLWAKTVRTIIPPPAFFRWELADQTTLAELRQTLNEAIPKAEAVTIRVADVPFYRTYKLAQIVDPDALSSGGRRCSLRYALFRHVGDVLDLISLNGASAAIHDANANKTATGERELIEERASSVEYLTFFCWGVDGDHGHFLIPTTAGEIPLTDTPSTEHYACLYGSRAQFGARRDADGQRWAARVLYGNAFFDARFSIQTDGVIEMNDDEPVVGDIPVEIQQFGSCGLVSFPFRSDGRRVSAPPAQTTRDVAALQMSLDGLVSPFIPKFGASIHADLVVIRNKTYENADALGSTEPGKSVAFVGCVFQRGIRHRSGAALRSVHFVGCAFGADAEDAASNDVSVDFSECTFEGNLTMERCVLRGRLLATGMHLAGSVRLRGIRVALEPMSLQGSVTQDHFREWQFKAPAAFEKRFDRPGIELSSSHVGGDLELGFDRQDKSAVRGELSLVAGDVVLTGCDVSGEVRLAGLWCTGALDLGSIHARSNCKFSVQWIETQLRCGSLSCQSATLERNVDMYGADVLGDCDFTRATLAGYLDLISCTIRGTFFLYQAHVGGFVRMNGLNVEHDVRLDFSEIKGMVFAYRTPETDGQPCRIRGELILSAADIRVLEMRGAVIDGDVVARGGHFGSMSFTLGVAKEGYANARWWPLGCSVAALRLTGVHIDEDLTLVGLEVRPKSLSSRWRQTTSENRDVTASVRINQCRIGGSLSFSIPDPCFTIENQLESTSLLPWGSSSPAAPDALSLPTQADVRASILGDLDLRATTIGGRASFQNMSVEGYIRLDDSTIGLDLEAEGSRKDRWGITKYDLTTICGGLSVQGLHCKGSMRLTGLKALSRGRSASRRLSVPANLTTGDFTGRAARVGGTIELCAVDDEPTAGHDAEIEGAFDLSASHVNRLILDRKNFAKLGGARDHNRMGWKVNLERAVISRFDVRRPPPPLDLTAVRIDRWELLRSPGEVQDEGREYVDILSAMDPLDRSVWVDVEKMLRNHSNHRAADRVYVAMREEIRRRRLRVASRAVELELHNAARRGDADDEFVHVREAEEDRTLQPLTGLLSRLRLGPGYWLESLHGFLFRYGTSPGRPFWCLNALLWPLMFVIAIQPANVTASDEQLSALSTRCRTEANVSKLCTAYRGAEETAEADVDLSPAAVGVDWGFRDGFALWLRYTLPIIAITTDTDWLPSSSPTTRLSSRFEAPFSPRAVAFVVVVANWIFLPLYLGFVTARLVRRSA
jgi:hypothetical protein